MEKKINLEPRFILALFCVVASAALLGYIVVKYGDKTEVLTLVVGIIGGTMMAGPLGFYFGGMHSKKPEPPGAASAEITASITSMPEL